MSSRPDRATEVTEPEAVTETKPEKPIIEMNGYVMETNSVSYKGKTYRFRELTVGENDLCREAAMGPDEKYDGREMMRMMIVSAAIAPEISRAEIEKIPSRLYAHMVDVVNTLNDPDTLETDPGNS